MQKFNKAFDEKDFATINGMMMSDARWYTLNGRVLRVTEIKPFFLPMMSRWHSVETKIKDIEIKKMASSRWPGTNPDSSLFLTPVKIKWITCKR